MKKKTLLVGAGFLTVLLGGLCSWTMVASAQVIAHPVLAKHSSSLSAPSISTAQADKIMSFSPSIPEKLPVGTVLNGINAINVDSHGSANALQVRLFNKVSEGNVMVYEIPGDARVIAPNEKKGLYFGHEVILASWNTPLGHYDLISMYSDGVTTQIVSQNSSSQYVENLLSFFKR
ncbi:MAG: hypothetical protein OWT27_08410 [Firmicutes bacterium]|nr:hypothetical protein [Bacillota bacterium]